MIQHSPDIKQVNIENLQQKTNVSHYWDNDVVIIETLPALIERQSLHLNLCVVMLCTGGHLRFKLNGKDTTLRQNQVMFCQPNVVLEDYMLSPDFECKILCMSDEIIRRLLVDKLNLWTMAVYVERTNIIDLTEEDINLFGYYHALIQIKTQNRAHTATDTKSLHAILRALLVDLSVMLARTIPMNTGETHSGMSHDRAVFLDFMMILSNAEVKKQSVEHYASMLCVSGKYLGQTCKRYSDKTACQWIRDYIKEDIRYYLSNPALSIKEVAVMLGFHNLSFFGKYVKKSFGMSPKVLRDHCLQP